MNVKKEPQKGICSHCGKKMPENQEPVRCSGWYNGEHYQLDSNRLARLTETRCPDCYSVL